ncbi:uncharacterized protein LOC117549722 isoform X1 [Gymnodraco acuticeps]|uniref:Uncharacterized protein LOC117549722 isoform X1 n=2 Tax=Gymnodraco acuticeps TaxID=8218 RepID=A0A6P8UKU7_GYMAC|nr:uncharacterized protein LOC117549722 isoform X1 [Gymnodraco acuticeps]XP_034077686.1 uncharacterized protein LOC117549722 isoform X1 [Gymnodraco acuticeps]XP_034077687.1 uncharacterized protein LOC117549722 isoform X1 [Gymnodraco acuticeps]XP_034077688.1 uncharacterized protein LOC117549722 isoform X1 [Gymnodraco acuticeps]XP_034077689.1 uncharacterized protein LOC117549722 isoform X1 [Gymnodraco acuticeps]XP_034077690.1 uncharacterized protein LOC117549722 isoform X1 [Gymnodraco acuticeps]
MFLKSEGMKSNDKETAKDAEEFAQLYRESWKFDIASQALTQLEQPKWNSPQLLPFTKDVQHLHSHLSEKQLECVKDLKEEVSPSNWKDLAKVTLAQVILFNRRREGEVSRMAVSAYLSRDLSETHEDVNLALTTLEQKLCNHFVRITIVGKRGRKVPVLLTPLMRESLDTLIQKREECGVLKENVFLFALPNSVHHLRGSDCLRQFVRECKDIKNPKALTSTKLRKHIATLSTVLNLKTTELDQLADFLGHNIEVHRKHYRLPEGTLQLAKISKVLLALEQGRIGEYKGMNLDEIHIDVNETVDMDGCSQEDMEDASMQEAEESEGEASMSSLQDSTRKVLTKHQKSAKKRDAVIQDTEESEGEASMSSLQDSTRKVLTKHQKSAKKRDAVIQDTEESEGEASMSSLPDSTRKVLTKHQKSAKKRGK